MVRLGDGGYYILIPVAGNGSGKAYQADCQKMKELI